MRAPTVSIALIVITATFAAQSCSNEWTCSSLTGDFNVSSTTPNGNSWDAGGDGAPDPSGILSISRDGRNIPHGSERVGTRHNAFEFTAPFFEKRGVTLQRGDVITIRLLDEDVGFNDPIGTAHLTVTGRTNNGSADNGAFSASITCEY